MIHRTDYHIHSRFSDGRSDPEDYLPQAIAAGLSEIGFSDHLTLFKDPQDWNMNPENVTTYIHNIETLRNVAAKIKIKTGLEVDYFEGKEDEIRSYLSPLPLDYVIGSVHYLGEKTVDAGPEFYEGKSFDGLFETYFNSVARAAESGLFNIIGHCDLIRIYGFRPSFDPEPLYRMLARTMKRHDVAFELNTNGKNRPLADFYPDPVFLHIFREEDVPVCVNSDAHMPARVGQHFDEAYELLRITGYTEMAVFDRRVRSMISM